MKKLLLGLSLLALVSACTNSDDTARVSFSLTDAPSLKGYQALYVDIQGIDYKVDSGEFVALPMSPVEVNLMNLTNGEDTLLGNVDLKEREKVTQVRLHLGDNNTLVLANGSEVNIKTPSGQTSGIKINIQSVASVSSGYKVLIDFDAEKSVVAKGNGTYSLKPVIRGYIVANTSKVTGFIIPSKEPFKVMAVKGVDTVMTISDTLLGNFFMLHGLTTDNYDIQFLDSAGVVRKEFLRDIYGGTNVDLDTVRIDQ
jgi:hypothetical protein